MKIIGLAVVGFMLIFAHQACGYTAYGDGAGNSCGTWIEYRKTDTKYYFLEAWILGFVSGFGYSGENPELKHTDVNAMSSFVDKYCRENPLKTVLDAAKDLVAELQFQKKLEEIRIQPKRENQ